jgi:glycosyltransferase involved in cell wall biosynthesis
MSEQVGFPLAMLDRGRSSHTVITHNLTTGLKRTLQRTIRWLNWFDALVVFNERQLDFVTDLGVASDRCHLLEYFVDDTYFSPGGGPADADLVSSFGLEHRDYACLTAAARRCPDVRFEVYAGSLWAKKATARETRDVPSNLRLMPFAGDEALRHAYRRSAVVVVPIVPGTLLSAGVTSVLEAQATATPVIASSTPGLTRYLDAGAEAIPPGDPIALAEAITSLLGDRPLLDDLADRGLEKVRSRHRLDDYATQIARLTTEAAARRFA